MTTYNISQKAQLDIIEIWEYTFKKWSLSQADKYYNLILDEIELLAQNPLQGIDYGKVRRRYLGRKIQSHIIFYRVAKKNEVEIIRILHSRMDLLERLNE